MFDPVSYRQRNRVERLFGTAKQFRLIATRYDQLMATYLGLLHLVLGFIRLRKQINVNRPWHCPCRCSCSDWGLPGAVIGGAAGFVSGLVRPWEGCFRRVV